MKNINFIFCKLKELKKDGLNFFKLTGKEAQKYGFS